MLRKNKIFLNLLGSFYDNTAYTDFSSRLDYIYTSIILNTYVSTLRSTVLSNDSSAIPNNINFGYINIQEIDTQTSSVIIRDINGVAVEEIDFFSFAYLDIEKFFEIDNGVISSAAMDELSKYSSAQVPVVYMCDISRDIFRNGIFRFVDNITDASINKIIDSSLRIVSDQIVYFPDTIKLLLKLSNILLGAIYSTSFENVLYVSDTRIVTTKNEYILEGINEGRSIVSVGQELKPSELITSVATISSDIAFIDDVTKIISYINSAAPSYSNTVFLNKLSSAIAKKRAVVIIEPEIFAETDTAIISLINSIFKMSISTEVTTTSGIFDSSTIVSSSDMGWIIVSESNVNINAEGYWDLTISIDNTIVTGISNESTILEDHSSVFTSLDMVLGLEPILDSSVIKYSDEAVYKIDHNSVVEGSEIIIPYGEYVDTNIVKVSDEDAMISIDSNNIATVSDGGGAYSDVTVSINSNISASEIITKTISAKKAAVIMIGDILNNIAKIFNSISIQEYLGGDVNFLTSDIISYSESSSIMTTDVTNSIFVEGEYNSSASIELFDVLSSAEVINTKGEYLTKELIDISSIDNIVQVTASTILVEDASDIESENTIDS